MTTRWTDTVLSRRRFLGQTASAGMTVAGAFTFPPTLQDLFPELFKNYPTFNWHTVPTAVDLGNSSRTWTADEASFLVDHFSLVSIEKSHGIGEQPLGAKFTEVGFRADAAQLKQFSRQTSVLFYWSARDYSPAYEAAQHVKAEWLQSGVFDLDNLDCRRWWVDVAVQMARDPNVDGVFADSLARAREDFPTGAQALIEELRAGLDTVRGRRRLILYNLGAHGMFDDDGRMDPLLHVADGAFNEDFDRPEAGTSWPGKRKRQLLEMWEAAGAGKIVILKGWPRFTFLWEYARTSTYEDKVAKARAEILFPLAAFLVAARRHTYFHYSWGYNMADRFVFPAPPYYPPDAGAIIETAQNSGVVDPLWYPELLRPLGPPLQHAQVDGSVCTRRFAKARVWADLHTREARIDWRD